jgi:uncharacterized membrane protein
MAVVAYILFFVPLLTGDYKKSPFVKFHANQGTVLFLAALAYGIAYGILSRVLVGIFLSSVSSWGFVSAVGWLMGLLWLAPLALCVLGIVNAATGKVQRLPVIGGFDIIK